MTRIFLLSTAFLLILSCSKDTNSKVSDTGKGGSLARFTIIGNYLYIVDNYSINTYNISDPSQPKPESNQGIGIDVETIFPYEDKLFIGSATGMFIFSLEDPAHPKQLGQVSHLRSCDPVIADGKFSYVTLRSGTPCGPATSGLYIYDVTDVKTPVLKSLLELESPWGLGLKDSVVFVCQDKSLTLVNVKDPVKPKLMYEVKDAVYRDVIPYGNLLICYVTSGLLLYDISDLNRIVKISEMHYHK